MNARSRKTVRVSSGSNCPNVQEGTCSRGCRGLQCLRRAELRPAEIKAAADRLEYLVANNQVHAASTFTKMRELLNEALALAAPINQPKEATS